MKIQELLSESNAASIMQSLVSKDQSERQEYANFVKTKMNGDYDAAAKKYAELKNRPEDDIFGERQRLKSFIKQSQSFDYKEFTDSDWQNFWLLAQHADFDVGFQKSALEKIKAKFGTNSQNYKYLHDRITCNTTGTQKYGTQDVCGNN
jgi:hypothetical protein